MSDTPQTDEATLLEPYGVRELPFEVTSAEFCRKLERERDQWRECAERLDARLRKSTDWTPSATYKDNQQAIAEFERLKGETK